MVIYKILILILYSWLTLTFNAQEKLIPCNTIKKGRFVVSGPEGGSIKIKRTHRIQTERYSRQNVRFRFDIEWIDDCNYILTLRKSKIISLKKTSDIKLYVTITDINKYYYKALIRANENSIAEEIEIQIR